FVVMVVVTAYTYLKSGLFFERLTERSKQLIFEMPLTLALFFILSSELLNIMDLAGQKDSYKLGLSIFWGIYSLVLVGIGIALGRQHLRLIAIVLFGITLLKLFFYDLDSLDTLSKTAVFVSLGVMMLLVSFLYHKYKGIISKSDDLGERL
ncbi:MAG: DUF2339 domain-containing protein, partial [Pyrinomonadaceae bacterium]